jgi:glutathione S-transferase
LRRSWARALGLRVRKLPEQVPTPHVRELTIVDIMMSFPVQLAQVRGSSSGLQLPRMKEFIARMEARPAYQRAVAKGGPLEIVA